jgi:excisionase family DNA binding protein
MADTPGAQTLTIKDLMQRWSCSYTEVLTAIHEKRLGAFKVGKRIYRVTLAEVERFERGADQEP